MRPSANMTEGLSQYDKEISQAGWEKAVALPTGKGGFTSGGQDKAIDHPTLKEHLASFLVVVLQIPPVRRPL